MKRFIKYFAPLTSEDVITLKTLTEGNGTDVILIAGAGLDRPIVYVRLEPMQKPKSTEEPTNEKIDATADTSWDDNWDDWGEFTDAPDEGAFYEGSDTLGIEGIGSL